MTVELIVGIVAAVVAGASAILSVWGQLRAVKFSSDMEIMKAEARQLAADQKVISQYQEPLARAAYDLQARLYNFVKCGAIESLNHKDERIRIYYVQSTLFLLLQYFGWMEITRRDLQFVDLKNDEKTRELYKLQEDIAEIFADGNTADVKRTALWIFKMEQRALGESMIVEANGKKSCLGYGAFLTKQSTLLGVLEKDLEDKKKMENNFQRLGRLQRALVDLVSFLDPEHIRFAEERTIKIEDTSTAHK
jgi:hypothetical protein